MATCHDTPTSQPLSRWAKHLAAIISDFPGIGEKALWETYLAEGGNPEEYYGARYDLIRSADSSNVRG